MSEPQRILLIRPSALGDVCRTAPVVAALKRRYPRSKIDWLVNDAFAPAIRAHPDLSGVVEFPRRRFGPWWRSPRIAGELRRWLGGLRSARYDLVIDCQGLLRSGCFAWWTGSERRIGYSNAAEMGWLGLTERVFVSREMHAVDRMMALAHAAGASEDDAPDIRLYTSEADRASLDARLTGRRFALLAPTSRWDGKRWPMDRFAALAHRLVGEGLAERVAFVGAPGEREQCAALLEASRRDERIVDLVGATSVGGLMAAVEASAIVVANDSAALHMAVGFVRPLVALFGPTRVDLVGPYCRGNDVIQKVGPAERLDHKDEGAGRRLMERIGVEEVFEACSVRLARADTISRC